MLPLLIAVCILAVFGFTFYAMKTFIKPKPPTSSQGYAGNYPGFEVTSPDPGRRRKQVNSDPAPWKAYVPENNARHNAPTAYQNIPQSPPLNQSYPPPPQQQPPPQNQHLAPPPQQIPAAKRSDSPPKKKMVQVYFPPRIPLPMYGADWGQQVGAIAQQQMDGPANFPQQPQQPVPMPPPPVPNNTPPNQLGATPPQYPPAHPPHHHQQWKGQDEQLPVFGGKGRDIGTGMSEVEERATMHSIEVPFSELSLGALIGEGGFGKVYSGKWRGMSVAIKVLSAQHLNEDLILEFRREVALMSALRHPNVVLLMGASVVHPELAIITELMPRGSLWNVLHDSSISLDWNMVYRMSRDTARGLLYLHSFKPPILHRDLKSGNLLVDNGFNVKLSDFGLSRVRSHTYTMTGQRGTFQWMAPEVLANARYSESADVYSFGVIVWEMCTRDLPYSGLNPMQAAMGVLNQGLRPAIPSWCPQPLAQMMQQCWHTTPTSRPPTAHLVDTLENLCP